MNIPPVTRRRLARLDEPIVVRKLWAGRSRSTALYVRLITRDETNVAEVSAWHIDAGGCMQPGAAVTVALTKLPELTAALLAAHRRAIELALITDRRGQS